MKKTIILASAVLGMVPAVFAATTSVPKSPVITYGLIRDEYGTPYTAASGVSVSLVAADAPDGKVYARSSVADRGTAGLNYRLSLELDSIGPERDYAVLEGTQMKIRCQVGAAEATLSPVSVFATPKAGTVQRLDYSTGTDVDGDGLPDAWEEWSLEIAGKTSSAEAIAAFTPDGDDDGDGMSNRAEYLAGTDPFLSTEMFEITDFKAVEGTSRVMIRFTSMPDRKYHVVYSEKLGAEAVWVPVPTSKTVDGAAGYEKYSGTGRVLTIYAPRSVEGAKGFFRIVCN